MLHVYKILLSLNLRKKLDEVRGEKRERKREREKGGEEGSLNMNMSEERFTGKREGEEEEEERRQRAEWAEGLSQLHPPTGQTGN